MIALPKVCTAFDSFNYTRIGRTMQQKRRKKTRSVVLARMVGDGRAKDVRQGIGGNGATGWWSFEGLVVALHFGAQKVKIGVLGHKSMATLREYSSCHFGWDSVEIPSRMTSLQYSNTPRNLFFVRPIRLAPP